MIAIGPTTAEAMNKENFEVYKICNKPSPEDLLTVIKN